MSSLVATEQGKNQLGYSNLSYKHGNSCSTDPALAHRPVIQARYLLQRVRFPHQHKSTALPERLTHLDIVSLHTSVNPAPPYTLSFILCDIYTPLHLSQPQQLHLHFLYNWARRPVTCGSHTYTVARWQNRARDPFAE